jgi:hypothetical protein
MRLDRTRNSGWQLAQERTQQQSSTRKLSHPIKIKTKTKNKSRCDTFVLAVCCGDLFSLFFTVGMFV